MKNSFKSGLLLIFLMLPSISTLPQKKEDPVRFMTYNIRWAGTEASDSVYAWNIRKGSTANIIRFNKADIIGLQEALKVQLDDFSRLMPEYKSIGAGRDDGRHGGEHSSILYKSDRFTVLESETFWLSETPDVPSKGWDASFNRVVTWAKFQDKQSGRIFYHFNTHFDHIGEKARLNSSVLLLKKVKEIAGGYPTVVTGDFNFQQNSDYYRILTDQSLSPELQVIRDAQKISASPHYGGNVSFNDFNRNKSLDLKIDYIFVKNRLKVLTHGIISEKLNGRFPSDHMPVAADIDLSQTQDTLFFDDFSGNALDRSKWGVRITGFTVNNEQQAYVDSQSTIHIASSAEAPGAENGALVIEAQYRPGFTTPEGKKFDFISGRMDTRGKFEFVNGTVSARMKLPEGTGLWPAFWVLGTGRWPDTGEIDIMENVGESDWTSVALHGPGYSGETPLVNKIYFTPENDAAHWHVYSVDWTQDGFIFKVDGEIIYRASRPMVEHYGKWAFHNPKYIILNLALGGAYPVKTNGVKTPYPGIPGSTVEIIKQSRAKVIVDWVCVTN